MLTANPDLTRQFKFNRYLPVALIYLFFNSAGMPEGLLLTSLMTPYFLLLNLNHGYGKAMIAFVLITLLFACIHTFNGIHAMYYLRSWMMAFCNFQFILTCYHVMRTRQDLPRLFRSLTAFNALMVLLALGFLITGFYRLAFWYLIPVSPGLPEYPRLKLLTSEASVYSLMITPLFLFYFVRFLQSGFTRYRLLLLSLLVSLLLSFSLGVMACLIAATGAIIVFHSTISGNRKKLLLYAIGLVLGALLCIYIYSLLVPDNLLIARVRNILSGNDTSARGRTYESFQLAWRMVQTKSIWFGTGLGQIKEFGRPVILEFYRYLNIPETVRIPNACAELLVYYGIFGLLIKLSLVIGLFFKTHVLRDPFRLSCFVFVFIYQFTGSYFTSIPEYILWLLAFVPMVHVKSEEIR